MQPGKHQRCRVSGYLVAGADCWSSRPADQQTTEAPATSPRRVPAMVTRMEVAHGEHVSLALPSIPPLYIPSTDRSAGTVAESQSLLQIVIVGDCRASSGGAWQARPQNGWEALLPPSVSTRRSSILLPQCSGLKPTPHLPLTLPLHPLCPGGCCDESSCPTRPRAERLDGAFTLSSSTLQAKSGRMRPAVQKKAPSGT